MAAVAVVRITIVLDMMCPWSFIGLRSLELAMRQAPSGVTFEPTVLPFEFDPPGTYPAEGQPWTEYCEGYGAEKAAFLLGQKLPRAFALGEAVGIDFSLERRIVGTETVNAALTAVQRHGGSAVAFALTLLSHHFEQLRDPNDPELLRPLLRAHGVPEAEWPAILEPSPQRAAANAAATQQGRAISGGSVPRFVVRCGDSDEEIPGPAAGPTSPDFFSQLSAECLARSGSGSGSGSGSAPGSGSGLGSASDKTCLKSDDAEAMRDSTSPWLLFGNRTAPGDRAGFFTAETTEHWPAGRVIRNVSHPSLVPHLADPAHPQHDGTAVVVAPGGAYKWLTWDAEGADIAAWLNSIGVSAFLLKYRVPFRPWLCKPGYGCRSGEAPLMDAQRAMVAVTESCRLGCILLKMTAILLLTGAPALARRLARHQRLPHRLHGLQRRRPRHRARVHDLLRRSGAGVPSHRRRG